MQKIPSPVSVGTDLEMFLYDNESERIVPCVGILDGTKEKPFKPAGYSKGYAIQEDNVMVEFNIPPQQDTNGFIVAVRTGRAMVLDELSKRYGSQYSLDTRTVAKKFNKAQLDSKQAQLIGCEPDFDAYEGGKVRINPPAPGMYRSCGGHIHLGGDFKCPDWVAALFAELFIGVRGRIQSTQTKRKDWYGKPGVFRPKPYGIEYRTPDNSWAKDYSTIETAGAWALVCAKFLTESDPLAIQRAFRSIPWTEVREWMNTPNKNVHNAKVQYNRIMKAAKTGGMKI